MADSDSSDKTFEPTEKKLSDARKKGDVASAPEMRHASMFVAAVAVTGVVGAWTVSALLALIASIWGNAGRYQIQNGAQGFVSSLLGEIGLAMGPLFGLLVVFALLTMFLQGRPTLSWSRLKPKWDKLSPLAGMKRLFGTKALVEFAKTLAKFALVTAVVLLVVWPRAREIETMVGQPVGMIGKSIATLVFTMVGAATVLVCALAVIDFIYQRHAFLKKMRMSQKEIRDEHKEAEGDPKIKAKVRAIGMERAKRRMMSKVPEASVVIVNPTHYAVALKYDHGAMSAPIVVAKGVDAVALKIREIATGANIPIVEKPPLARALYASADLDRPIPLEHYAAVAEIIGHIMRLARRNR